MDAETLKIILALKEENIILRDVISTASYMLSTNKEVLTFEYHDLDSDILIKEVLEIIHQKNKN